MRPVTEHAPAEPSAKRSAARNLRISISYGVARSTRIFWRNVLPGAAAGLADLRRAREQLDCMRRREDVAIVGDNECRRGDAANLLGEVESLFHRVADLVEQSRPVLRAGRNRGVH